MNINADNYSNYTFDEDGFIRLQKDLNYGLRHLDSQNVERLFTNQTQIQSENGLTNINGPLLDMYDTGGTLRLRAGYDTNTNEFLFTLYNQAGQPTIDLSDTGDALVYNIHTSQDVYVGRRIFVDWDSTQTVNDAYPLGFPYEGGLFIRTPSTDFPGSGERHMAGSITVGRLLVSAGATDYQSSIYPYSHGVRFISSAFLGIYGQTITRFINAAEIGDLLTTNLGGGKSTNTFDLYSFSGIMNINTYIPSQYFDSTLLQGTFMGPINTREIYIGNTKNSSNRVALEGTQRYYKSQDDLIYYYQRNMRQFDEGLSTNWKTITNNARVGYTQLNRTIGYNRPYVVNSTTGTQFIYMDLTTDEGLIPFNALSFNDGNSVSTNDDFLVWSFFLQNSSNMNSSTPYLQIGNNVTNHIEFRCPDIKPPQEGWNVYFFKFTDKRTSTGAPNLNSAAWIRCGFRLDSAASTGDTYLVNNFIGVIRAHPDNSTSPLAIQKLNRYTLTWDSVGYSGYNNEVIVYDTHIGELSMAYLNPTNNIGFTQFSTRNMDNFTAYCKYAMGSSDFSGPIIGQAFDVNNFWFATITSGYMQIYVNYNSSQYLNVSKAFTNDQTYYDQHELWVSRSHNGFIEMNFKGSGNLFGCLEGYLPDAWYYQRENIVIGNDSTVFQRFVILDMEVRPYDK